MPAPMKASIFITVHYRNGIRTISAVRITLAYVTEIAYSRGYRHLMKRGYEQQSPYPTPNLYSQYNKGVVGILATLQVSHCLRAAFGSRHRREVQALLVD
jgi:predicted metal-dependent HD superfamily phosphohydrolase